MNSRLSSFSQSIVSISTIFLFFTFPLFFLPTTANFFETNKLMLLLIVVALNLLAWALNIIGRKELRLTIAPFTLPILALGVIYLVSSFIASSNPIDSLINGGAFIPTLSLFVFSAANVIDSKKFANKALYALIASGVLLSFISIFQSLGFGLSTLLNRLLGTSIPDTLAFTPAGSPMALLTYLAPLLVLTLFLAFSKKENLEKIVLFLLSAIMTAGLVLVIIYSFPGKDTAPVFLPVKDGYAIAIETFKNTGTALLGYGPGNFLNAYNQTRSAALNLTDFWNIRFNNSSNEVFQIITTTGLLGFACFVWMAVSILKTLKTQKSPAELGIVKLTATGLLFLLVLVPGTYTHLFIFFAILLVWSVLLKTHTNNQIREINLNLESIHIVRPDEESGTKQSPIVILPYLFGIPLVALVVTIGFFSFKAYLAEVYYKQSLDAANRNDGLKTYDLQRQTITTNPYVARYRRAYSTTNLALANSIASNKELSDQDKNNITQLIQQSIREAKAAVTLDPQNTVNWENLTYIYRSLINVAQNADNWTMASISQAIQTDPVNPRLRLELGGIYYSLNQFDQAIRLYQQAAELKPNWANAYYNLAASYRQKKELTLAYDYLRQTLSLVEPDSADYTKAQEELTVLAKELNLDKESTNTPQAKGDLNTPTPLPSVKPENQVNLPDNSGPADAIKTQTPTPTSAPEPTPQG